MGCLRQRLVRHRKGRGSADAGAARVSANMPVVMKQVFDTMSQTTGVDFTEILRPTTMMQW